MKEGTGRLFVVTAPSGAGKTSLSRELVGQVPALRYSISHTTRAPRGEEHTNGDYHFVDRVTFQRMIDQGEFAEWAEVHGHFYGTSLNEIDRARWEKD
ncbi:MAG: hypothetical protein M5R36_22095 [Deltaproteobacteria bacterium]|nr:hypothetical protein [Deltaproteobacteria bacterium]